MTDIRGPLEKRPFAADGLKADLRRRILAGEMPSGTRIAPARELARSYSISYATCHKALAELEAGGFLVRHQGRGTFVAEGADERGRAGLRASLLWKRETHPNVAAAVGEFCDARPGLEFELVGHDVADDVDVRQLVSYQVVTGADGLLPLDDLAKGLIKSVEFDRRALNMFRVNGSLRAIPGYFAPMVFYANRRVFRKAGVDVPESWTVEELIETSSALEGARGCAGVVWPKLYMMMPLFWVHGVEPGSNDRWGLDSPAAPKALDAIRRWRRATSVEQGDNGYVQLAERLLKGQMAAVPWSGGIIPLLADELGEDLAIIAYPSGPADYATVMTGEGLTISNSCSDPGLAWNMVESIAEADARDVAARGIRLSARTGLRGGDWIDVAVSAAADGARVVEAAGDRDVFGLMQRMLEEFAGSDEDAAGFADRAGSVVEALSHARRSEVVGAGEAVG